MGARPDGAGLSPAVAKAPPRLQEQRADFDFTVGGFVEEREDPCERLGRLSEPERNKFTKLDRQKVADEKQGIHGYY